MEDEFWLLTLKVDCARFSTVGTTLVTELTEGEEDAAAKTGAPIFWFVRIDRVREVGHCWWERFSSTLTSVIIK